MSDRLDRGRQELLQAQIDLDEAVIRGYWKTLEDEEGLIREYREAPEDDE